jgi:hypothetical protein
MEAEQVWELFKETGNIGVYMLYKHLQNDKKEGEKTSNADSDGRSCN